MDATSNPLQTWNSRGLHIRTEYDVLRRPVAVYAQRAEKEALMRKMTYGESVADSSAHNLRGRLFREQDQAGIVTYDEYGFRGNELSISRQFALEYKSSITWTDESAIHMLPEVHATTRTFNALSRITTINTADASTTIYTYNEGGLLHSISTKLKGQDHATRFISVIEYGAHERIIVQTMGNGTTTTTSYDRFSQRLIDKPIVDHGRPQTVQSLHYCYDAVGNVTSIENKAEQTIFFRNKAVRPDCEYTYHATYRLVESTGRENLAQTKGGPSGPAALSAHNPVVGLPDSGTSLARYIEQYAYDLASRMTSMKHQTSEAAHPGWTRAFKYGTSIDATMNNRLVETKVGNSIETYSYDTHGNMTSMPHLSKMQWDHENRMHSSLPQRNNNGTPETTWYVYDGAGRRVRKATERQASAGAGAPSKLKETFVVGGFEIYQQYDSAANDVRRKCETLHITRPDGDVALVEDWSGGIRGESRLFRFQLRDRSGSINIELSETGIPISYEEYTPYGSTSLLVESSETPKRYRYAGKERDSENELYYSEQRYYIPWLARWLSPDPLGIADGLNVFEFVASNPLRFNDPSGLGKEEHELTHASSGPFLDERVTVDSTAVNNVAAGVQQAAANAGPVLNRGLSFLGQRMFGGSASSTLSSRFMRSGGDPFSGNDEIDEIDMEQLSQAKAEIGEAVSRLTSNVKQSQHEFVDKFPVLAGVTVGVAETAVSIVGDKAFARGLGTNHNLTDGVQDFFGGKAGISISKVTEMAEDHAVEFGFKSLPEAGQKAKNVTNLVLSSALLGAAVANPATGGVAIAFGLYGIAQNPVVQEGAKSAWMRSVKAASAIKDSYMNRSSSDFPPGPPF